MSSNLGPRVCLVTGGNGVVGQRLVEILLEKGSELVISFDIIPPVRDSSSPFYSSAISDPRMRFVQGDLTRIEDLEKCLFLDKDGKSTVKIECIFHIAALVGPYHAEDQFMKVNFEGCRNILKFSRKHEIKRIVLSSSPSTRFPYPDPTVEGLTEDDLFRINGGDYPAQFHQPYAASKALGEKEILAACGKEEDDLLTIAVAPHQIYGPRDRLFLPSLLQAAGSGWLRVFGDGSIRISMCHVDNYCHGLLLANQALRPGSPALGKFYIVTDGDCQLFWPALDQAVTGMGFRSLLSKASVPIWLLFFLAYGCYFLALLISTVTSVPFHRVDSVLRLNPFTLKMLSVHRSFRIDRARRDLGYEPVKTFQQGWPETIGWFRENWLPTYQRS